MSDSDDFVNGLREQYGDPGHDLSHPGAPWGIGLLEKGLEYGGAFARGSLKQSAEAPGLRAMLPQAFEDWAKEKDPEHPDVESYGRYVTPTNVLLARLPDLPALAASAQASWPVRAASQLAQNTWKSAIGGATQADTDTPSGKEAARRTARGAAEGVGTSLGLTAAQSALRALPHWMAPGVIAGVEMMHGRYMPWHIRHAIASGLAAIAARAAQIPAALVGAGGEAAAQREGYEPGGGEQQNQEPF